MHSQCFAQSVVSNSLQPHGLSTEFSSQEYWDGLPFPSSGDLPNSGIEPEPPVLQADSSLGPPGKETIDKTKKQPTDCDKIFAYDDINKGLFSQIYRVHRDGQEDIKRCSMSLIFRETHIKTTVRYHHILVRMAIIKKSTNSNCQRRCGEKESLLHCRWECKLVQPLWKIVRRFLRKLKLEIPYDTAIPLPGIYPEKISNQTVTCTPMFIAALFMIAKT